MAEAPTKFPAPVEARKNVPVTTAAPWAPLAESWTPFESLRREVDRLFENFGMAPSRLPMMPQMPSFEPTWPLAMATNFDLAVDVVEKDQGFEISAEFPGMEAKDIEVKVSGGGLTIRGEKREQTERKGMDYHLSERRYGACTRTFRLPEGVDSDKIEASVSKGILTVRMPKTKEAQAHEKRIEVKAA